MMGYAGYLWGIVNLLPVVPTFTIVPGVHAVTVSVESEDQTVTNVVKYKGTDDIDWNSGGSVVGDGNVVIEQLDNEVPYIISVYGVGGAGFVSLPAVSVIATIREHGIISQGEC